MGSSQTSTALAVTTTMKSCFEILKGDIIEWACCMYPQRIFFPIRDDSREPMQLPTLAIVGYPLRVLLLYRAARGRPETVASTSGDSPSPIAGYLVCNIR